MLEACPLPAAPWPPPLPLPAGSPGPSSFRSSFAQHAAASPDISEAEVWKTNPRPQIAHTALVCARGMRGRDRSLSARSQVPAGVSRILLPRVFAVRAELKLTALLLSGSPRHPTETPFWGVLWAS